MKLADNPVYLRLTRKAGQPSLLGTGVLALAMAVGLWAWCAGQIGSDTAAGASYGISAALDRLIPLDLGWLIALPVVGIAAALVTLRDMTTENLMLMRASALSGRSAVIGYVAGVLFRLRLPLAVYAATLPSTILLASTRGMLALSIYQPYGGPTPGSAPGLALDMLMGTTLPTLIGCLGQAAWVVWSAALGVLAALRLRRPAVTLGLVGGLFVGIDLLYVIPAFLYRDLGTMVGCWPGELCLTALVLGLLPITVRLGSRAYARADLGASPSLM